MDRRRGAAIALAHATQLECAPELRQVVFRLLKLERRLAAQFGEIQGIKVYLGASGIGSVLSACRRPLAVKGVVAPDPAAQRTGSSLGRRGRPILPPVLHLQAGRH